MTGSKPWWLVPFLEELKTNPVASNVIIGFLLVFFEKMLDLQFVCPCYGETYNRFIVSLYFVGPALIVLVLLYCIQLSKFLKTGEGKCFSLKLPDLDIGLFVFVPPFTWIILLLLDGRYVACGMTDWTGAYEAPQGGLTGWCKPDGNLTEKLTQIQKWYTDSQVSGIIISVIGALICLCLCCCREKQNSGWNQQGQKPEEQNDMADNSPLIPIGPTILSLNLYRENL